MSVVRRFRRSCVFRTMLVHMRVRVRMTVDQVAVAMLMVVGMGVGMLTFSHFGASINLRSW